MSPFRSAKSGVLLVVAFALHVCISPARAEFFGNAQGGADFPAGDISFADAVVDFSPVIKSGQPTAPHLQSDRTLGVPDYDGTNSFTADPDAATFASLGDGGSITLRFIDNRLTGSDSSEPDLFIFEVGPDVEDTFVEISTDGVTFFSVGKVGGSFSTVDIDAFGFTTADEFAYVRLTDDPDLDGQTGITVGPDIDAVGAIIPEPATLALLPLLASMLRPRQSPPPARGSEKGKHKGDILLYGEK